MQWEREHPDVMRATAEFVRIFREVPDPIISVAKKALSLEAKIAWVLFGSCLHQEISLPDLQRILEAIYEKFPGKRLWSFPLATESEILQAVEQGRAPVSWSLAKSVPGIFWSVGNFVRRRLPLTGWAFSSSNQGMLRDLGEIFFMGKGAYRPKAIEALARIFSEAPRGLGISKSQADFGPLPVPFSFGARLWIGYIGPGKEIGYSSKTEIQKRSLGISLSKTLCPGDPLAASHAFQFFWEKSERGLACALQTNACKDCPLSPYCPRSLHREV